MRRVLSCLSVLALVVGLAALPTPDVAVAQSTSFTDVAGNAHEENIRRLADRGVTRGCADGRFCPEAPVTRQEMATFLARALGLRASSGPSRFNDVTNPAHRPNIEAIASRGITTGVTGRCAVPTQPEGEDPPSDPRFCPLDPVSRNQMAVFLERAFDIETARPIGLTDVDEGSFHAPAIGAALSAGITRGCSPGDRYCGGDDVKRGQMASFLMRALDVVGRRTSCPATSGRQDAILDIATQGFPVNSAIADVDNDRLYLFTNGLSPQRLVVVELSTQTVLRNIEVPGAGSRVWASTIAGDFLYFGRWGTADHHNFYRVPLADLLASDADPRFTAIGMGGLHGDQPLDNRIRGNDGLPLRNREFWALTSDDDGRVYAGTGRQDTVYRFTPPELTGDDSGSVQAATLRSETGGNLPSGPPNSKREITALAWTPNGLVVGTGRGQGIARVVDTVTLEATAGAGSQTTWPSRGLSLGSASDGIVGVYDATVRQPVGTGPEKVLLTTEEERARLVEVTVPGDPVTPLPTSGSNVRAWRSPVAEPILHAPALAPSTNPVAVGSSTTRLYERLSTGLVSRGTPVPASVTRSMFTVTDGGATALIGVTANGTVWRRPTADAPADQTTRTRLESSPLITRGPERPQSLSAARNDNGGYAIVGGNNKVTVHTLPGSTTQRAPQDVLMPGEAKAVLAQGSSVYAATYPGGELRRFTISRSGVVREASQVISWSDTYNRPRDLAYDDRHQRLVIAAKSDFEGFGAIISVRRDGTGVREWNTGLFLTPRNLASQEPLTLAVVPQGAASPGSPEGTAIIGTPNGYVTGFDHVNGRKLWEVRPTTASVRGLTVTPDGTIHGLTTTGTRFRIVDGSRGVVTTSPFRGTDRSAASSLLTEARAGEAGELTHVDGQLVAGTANRLVAIDPGTGAERLLSEGSAPTTFTSRAHAAAVPGSGCQDVLTFRRGSTTDARVARAQVRRP